MFILFGIRNSSKELGALSEGHSCPSCREIMYPVIIRNTAFFTLFFIPIIPVYMSHYLICTKCNSKIKVPFSAVRKMDYE